MPRKLSSFLIRWWRSDDGERLEVEHIQSGHRRLASSVSDALSWMSDEADAQGAEGDPSGASQPGERDEALCAAGSDSSAVSAGQERDATCDSTDREV